MKSQNTVFIVDDEAGARDLLEGLLFREGYELAFAEGGLDLLAKIDAVNPDVILLDIMMPEMDGLEVCQRLKADERWRHIPIILVTALGGKEDLVRGLEAGADDFVHKPVDKLELRARVRSMLRIKQQYDEQQANLRLREDLARMIVHDIRNPLSVILGYSELMEVKQDVSPEELLKIIKRIQTEGKRLNSFLNDMLILAKMEAGQPLLHPGLFEANALVHKAVEGHDIIALSRKIDLIVDLASESRQVTLDRNMFLRVLDNLLSNALKFSPAGSAVTVRLQYPPQPSQLNLRLEVVDEGPGIPAEHRERIFDKFETLSLKRSGVPQVGLGLAFCKMVAEAHGGRIFVEPNHPTGSIFIVEI